VIARRQYATVMVDVSSRRRRRPTAAGGGGGCRAQGKGRHCGRPAGPTERLPFASASDALCLGSSSVCGAAVGRATADGAVLDYSAVRRK